MHKIIVDNINNENFGTEELNKEYKEFFLNELNLYFSEEEIINFLNNYIINKNKFNILVMSTLNKYILLYLPKYIGVFINSKLSGDLYFGIDDNGEKIGIPFFGIPNIEMISQSINECKIYLKSYYKNIIDNNFIDLILDNITVDILLLNDANNKKEEYLFNLIEYNKINKDIIENWNKYLEKYKEWHTEILYYSDKLSNFLISKEIRLEIADWIKTHIDNPIFKNIDLEKIIDKYKSDELIHSEISIDIIYNIKYDYSHPLKWLIDFKDYKHKTIKKKKPYPPLLRPKNDVYQKFSININNIFYPLHKQNCQFYIIKFAIPLINNNISIEYYSDKKKRWYKKFRIILNTGPSCH